MTKTLRIAVVLSMFFSSSALAVTGSKSVASPMGGNGHNVTSDGRLFVVARAGGWYAQVFRPQSVGTDVDGFPIVSSAFSPEFQVNNGANDENANALCETNAAGSPYRCDAGGAANAGGSFDCYDLQVFDSDALLNPAVMRRRALKVWVNNPGTASASVEKLTEGALEPLSTTLRGIEPTTTLDGKLLVFQGHPLNDGQIDILMYSVNANACSASGWSAPKPISSMHADPLVAAYRLAEKPLHDAAGAVFATGEQVHGAYPWIFPDGSAVIFSAVNMPCVTTTPENPPGCGPRRNGTSVLGYPTNWAVANIDGGINPSRVDTVRLFFSSPGPHTFAEIPTTPGHDVWPFFGSNTSNYTEVNFDDGLDGRYGGVWLMNELVQKDGTFDFAHTPDTSGYFNTGALLGGVTLPAANDAPGGKSAHFDGVSGRIAINDSPTLSPLYALTVEMTLRPDVDPDCDANNNYRLLLGKPFLDGPYSLVFEESRQLHARVKAGGVVREAWSNQAIPLGAWSKVAFTYLSTTGEIAFFIDGIETNRVQGTPAPIDGNTSGMTIGAPYAVAACPNGLGAFAGAIDDLRISNIVRYPTEISGNPTPTPTGTSTGVVTPTPTPVATDTPGGNGANGGSHGMCSTTGASGTGAAALLGLLGALAMTAFVRRRE